MCFEPRERHIQIRLDELIWTNQFLGHHLFPGPSCSKFRFQSFVFRAFAEIETMFGVFVDDFWCMETIILLLFESRGAPGETLGSWGGFGVVFQRGRRRKKHSFWHTLCDKNTQYFKCFFGRASEPLSEDFGGTLTSLFGVILSTFSKTVDL